MASNKFYGKRLLTIAEIAMLIADAENNIQAEDDIQGFIRDDLIPYAAFPDGILIPLGGFQTCMPNLYDLEIHGKQ